MKHIRDQDYARMMGLQDEVHRYRAALRDIETSQPIPTPGKAYEWCVEVAKAALNPKGVE